MALNEQELIEAYHTLIQAYPEDLRIARPLIQMLQVRGDEKSARNLAMDMARRMLALGYSSYALAFLSIAEQLGYPNVDEIESMKTMAELTLGTPSQSLSEAGSVFALIEALSDSESQDFLKQSDLIEIKAGDAIVSQNEVSSNFYLILDGEMKVCVDSKGGGHIEFGHLKRGDFFGEVACVYQLPRTATVSAVTDSKLLEFSDETVDAMLHTSPIAGDGLMKVVQRRMMETISYTHAAFTELDAADRTWLEDDSELVEFLPGDILNKNDEPDNQFCYVIVFGKVAARHAGAGCGLGVNSMYGDAIDALHFPGNTELKVLERTLACKIPKQLFETFFSTYAGFEHWVKKHVEKRNEKLLRPATEKTQ